MNFYSGSSDSGSFSSSSSSFLSVNDFFCLLELVPGVNFCFFSTLKKFLKFKTREDNVVLSCTTTQYFNTCNNRHQQQQQQQYKTTVDNSVFALFKFKDSNLYLYANTFKIDRQLLYTKRFWFKHMGDFIIWQRNVNYKNEVYKTFPMPMFDSQFLVNFFSFCLIICDNIEQLDSLNMNVLVRIIIKLLEYGEHETLGQDKSIKRLFWLFVYNIIINNKQRTIENWPAIKKILSDTAACGDGVGDFPSGGLNKKTGICQFVSFSDCLNETLLKCNENKWSVTPRDMLEALENNKAIFEPVGLDHTDSAHFGQAFEQQKALNNNSEELIVSSSCDSTTDLSCEKMSFVQSPVRKQQQQQHCFQSNYFVKKQNKQKQLKINQQLNIATGGKKSKIKQSASAYYSSTVSPGEIHTGRDRTAAIARSDRRQSLLVESSLQRPTTSPPGGVKSADIANDQQLHQVVDQQIQINQVISAAACWSFNKNGLVDGHSNGSTSERESTFCFFNNQFHNHFGFEQEYAKWVSSFDYKIKLFVHDYETITKLPFVRANARIQKIRCNFIKEKPKLAGDVLIFFTQNDTICCVGVLLPNKFKHVNFLKYESRPFVLNDQIQPYDSSLFVIFKDFCFQDVLMQLEVFTTTNVLIKPNNNNHRTDASRTRYSTTSSQATSVKKAINIKNGYLNLKIIGQHDSFEAINTDFLLVYFFWHIFVHNRQNVNIYGWQNFLNGHNLLEICMYLLKLYTKPDEFQTRVKKILQYACPTFEINNLKIDSTIDFGPLNFCNKNQKRYFISKKKDNTKDDLTVVCRTTSPSSDNVRPSDQTCCFLKPLEVKHVLLDECEKDLAHPVKNIKKLKREKLFVLDNINSSMVYFEQDDYNTKNENKFVNIVGGDNNKENQLVRPLLTESRETTSRHMETSVQTGMIDFADIHDVFSSHTSPTLALSNSINDNTTTTNDQQSFQQQQQQYDNFLDFNFLDNYDPLL